MGQKGPELSDEQLVYAYLAEYLDEDLPAGLSGRYETALKSIDTDENLLERFRNGRGQFELALQAYQLDERQMKGLHVLVEDDAARAAKEAYEMEKTERKETLGQVARWVISALVVIGVVGAVINNMKPKAKPAFNPLDTLVYEAMTMEDDPDGRLDLPTSSLEDVREYLQDYPELGFTPVTLSKVHPGWALNGASVIDYDIARIVVVQMAREEKPDEKLFLFMFKGAIEQLPKAEQGEVKGLFYRAYSSDKINVVTWQLAPQVLGMIVGHRGAKELAEVAESSTRS